ncbi:MAG TPA: hypothetical protein VGJ28_11755, partial [Micromonosporaceae bacterium]
MKRTGRVAVCAASVLVLIILNVPALASGASHHNLARRDGPATTGHFHALAKPYSTMANLGAHRNAIVHLGGHGDLPHSGLRAIAATLISAQPKGPTDVYAGESTKRPGVPALSSGSAPTSSFGILPVSSHGDLHLFGGAHATHVRVVVSGWFAASTESGTGGLFNQLPGRSLAPVKLSSGASKSVSALGHAAVPDAKVGALIVRVAVDDTSAAGTIGAAATSAGARHAVSIAYSKTGGSDLVVVRLSAGRFTLRNAGAKSATITVS